MANAPATAGLSFSRLRELIFQAARKISHAAIASRRRAAGLLAAVLLLATGVTWTLLVRNTVDSEERVQLADALEAFDEGRFDDARRLVKAVRQRKTPASLEHGGTAFILGAIKFHEAEELSSTDQKKAAHLIASRYLEESRVHGFPPGREAEGWLLLAGSLVEADKFSKAIEVLERALELNPGRSAHLHRLLATAHLHARDGDMEAAKRYSDLELADRTLAPHERAAAYLRRGEILLRRGEPTEIASLLAQLPPEIRDRGPAKMLQARLLMVEAEGLEASSPAANAAIADDAASKRRAAIEILRELQAAASLGSPLSRAAMYLIGQCYASLPGETDAALEQFSRLRKLHTESAEGIAASLAEAELLRRLGRLDEATAGYARTLRSVKDPATYSSPWLPLAMLRARILAANDALVAAGHFDAALSMVHEFPPTLDQAEMLWQRAQIHRTWGQRLMEASALEPAEETKATARLARKQFRQAARLYEELSDLRFAEREYPDDLWRAAESYLDGHSASEAIRVLSMYLEHEAVARRPQALVALGHAYLTSGEVDPSIKTLEECIELHDRDAAVYDARVLCARAYLEKNDVAMAEQLFRANLNAAGLTPASRVWRDSLLGLGQLYHAEGRYTEAIESLQEYVQRYGDEPDALLARYLVAQSHRHAAREPLQKLENAITENERLKHRTSAQALLTAAIENFSHVQRALTLRNANGPLDPLEDAILRNCYLLRGDVLFALKSYDQALDVFRNASSLYQNDPIALNAYLHIAWCHRRLDQLQEARGAIEQAKMVLGRLPEDAEFVEATGLSKQQWTRVLNDISQW